MADDEEHARLLLRAQKGDTPAWRPPLATWSPTIDLLATVVDELRGLRHLTLAVNSKGKVSPPMPYPRPRTAIERVRHEEREARHRALVARVLPNKAPGGTR